MEVSKNIFLVESINQIHPSEWNSCAITKTNDLNPFISHEFLSALEESGSVSQKTGIKPLHIVVKENNKGIQGCAPVYLKSHSYGEYVFDWNWAQAYEKSGGNYYPKLLVGIPFTPVTSSRLLLREKNNKISINKISEQLINTIKTVVRNLGISSAHITFPEEKEVEIMEKFGFLTRIGYQFHWENNNYNNFSEFLNDLSSKKRKNIKKERNIANSLDIKFKTLTGNDIKQHHWDAFFKFYLNTIDKKWGNAYLNRSFFEILSDKLSEKILLIIGEKNNEIVCGALNFIGSQTLFGRNWGTVINKKMVHFEACYYRAIDYAIKNNLLKVEAGAQGTHKIQRGYLPAKTYSSHWIENKQFRKAIENFLIEERKILKSEMDILNNKSPFKCD